MISIRSRSWRTLACAVFAMSVTSACEKASDGEGSEKTTTTAQGSTAAPGRMVALKGPFSKQSDYDVPNGDFSHDSLVNAILAAARAPEHGQDPWDDKHDRSDKRRVMRGDCRPNSNTCSVGPLLQIIPRKRSHTHADLGTGRVVAKIVNHESNNEYRKLGLYAGTAEAYWWVGKRPGSVDTISVYVPADWHATNKPAVWRAVTVAIMEPGNPGFRHSKPMARFLWNDRDDETWSTCIANGCCLPPRAIGLMDTTHTDSGSGSGGGGGGGKGT